MKTYCIPFTIEGTALIRAESPEDAMRRYGGISIDEQARMWGELESHPDELIEVNEDGSPKSKEPEGLARLKASDLVRF